MIQLILILIILEMIVEKKIYPLKMKYLIKELAKK
jgi:hypothetical protein